MTRDEILNALKQYMKENQRQYHIRRIGIFGSTVRNQMKESSDIDIVVELEKQDLFYLIGIKQDLEEALHYPIDVVSYRKNMNTFLKERIDNEAVYV